MQSLPGRRRARVQVHGILLLDKPPGVTSNKALQIAKRHLNAAKAGHTGALDPAATGLLPLCFGDATKVSAFLLDADKTYSVTALLGVRTDSGDLDGTAIERQPYPEWPIERWRELLAGFVGEQQQVPPMYSALKKDGRRLYELAREGQVVERAPRRIVVHQLDLSALDGDRLTFDVRCSKGTYIRSLVEDIASRAGTVATTAALRRTGVGPFDGEAMHTLDAVQAASGNAVRGWLLPIDAALSHWPAVRLDALDARRFGLGQAITVDDPSAAPGMVRVTGPDERCIGLGELAGDSVLRPKKVFAAPDGS